MPLTEVQLAKLIIEIDRLTTKADALEKEAQGKDAGFLSAAQIYGSELAGSPGTDYLYKEAREIRERTEFLKEVKNGSRPLSDFESYQRNLRTVQKNIDEDMKEEAKLKAVLKQFEFLHKLLSI